MKIATYTIGITAEKNRGKVISHSSKARVLLIKKGTLENLSEIDETAIVSSGPPRCSTLIDCSTCGVLRSTGKRTSKLSPIRKEKSPVQRKERTAHFTVAA